MEEKSLKEEVRKLSEALQGQQAQKEEERKTKKFRLPRKAKVSNGNLKKNYTTVAFINDNKEVTFTKEQIKEGTIIMDNCPYIATPDYMLTHKGKPMLILNSWSVEPFSPTKSIEDAAKEQKLTVGYRLLLNAMKSEVISAKKKMNIVFIIIGLIVLGVGAYFIITKSGGFHF